MDLIPSMFEFDLTDELFQKISYPCEPYSPREDETYLLYSSQQEETRLRCSPQKEAAQLPSPTDQLVDRQLSTDNQPVSGVRQRSRCLASKDSDEMNDQYCPPETKKKKIMHRDIERQRRQEMTTLYASLRSQLPLEYLRGKRSISDHMYQAVNYIKHLQRNIHELSHKRDELLRIRTDSCHSNSTGGSDNSQGSTVPDSLTVTHCSVGIEVVVNTARTGGIPLSGILGILMEEGLTIVSYISTKVNERMLHTIEAEVSDGRSIQVQPSELHQKLTRTLTKSHNGV